MSKSLRVGIVDLGISNITSVINAFQQIGFSCYLLNETNDGVRVDVIVLPGVGNFEYLVNCLNKSILRARILNHHKRLSLIHISEPTRPY